MAEEQLRCKFAELLSHQKSTMSPGEQQRRAIAIFPSLLAQSRVKLWRSSDAIDVQPTILLLGIATFSIGDLKLLDDICKHLSVGELERGVEIRVYNTADDPGINAFGGNFPEGLRHTVCTPTFAVWQYGILTDFGCGRSEVRSMLSRIIGLSN